MSTAHLVEHVSRGPSRWLRAGWLVAGIGWFHFFLLCAVLAVPGMLLLFKVAPWSVPANEDDR